MGALFLLIYNEKFNFAISDFTKGFIKMQCKGENDTVFDFDSTPLLSKFPMDRVSQQLSRRQIAEYSQHTFMYGYHRMAINDLTMDGNQPFEDPIRHKLLTYPDLRSRPQRKLFGTGEIYNYSELKEEFTDKDLQSNCDIEIIMPLYIKYGIKDTVDKLNGEYSFFITENTNSFILDQLNVFIARDPLGSRSLYMAQDDSHSFWLFVSELKAIPDTILNNKNVTVQEFPAGSIWSFQKKQFEVFFNWDKYLNIEETLYKDISPNTLSNVYHNILTQVTNAVQRRFELSERSIGCLLSGGFDSSIILSILAKLYGGNATLHAFTIGDLNSQDVINAKEVIKFIEVHHSVNVVHHIISVNFVDIETKIDNVIRILETYDLSNVRAGVCFSYLFEYIKKFTDVKVLLTGEGLDELCCGYNALDNEFQQMSIQSLKNLSKFDLMRCDKLGSSYGLELRNPFLDMNFVTLMLKIHPKLKRPQVFNYNEQPIEKYIVRKAFDYSICNEHYLPNNILWRYMSNANEASCKIKDAINAYCNDKYTLDEVSQYCLSNNIKEIFSKEDYHYLKVFLKHYPKLYNISRLN